jgi:PAS domain S-box-containing protein
MFSNRAACQIVEAAADAIRSEPAGFNAVLDAIPAAIYVTDRDGTLTYFNAACVELAGRTPEGGADKWCVTWKLYTTEGEPLPHDRCPMAQALSEATPVRGVEAIAERPDGSRFHFVPYPTPLFDARGDLSGAVNLLLDVSTQRTPEYLQAQADRCRQLAHAVGDRQTVETLTLMEAKYEELARKLLN